MDIIFKKSSELTDAEKHRFDELFAICFEGKRLPIDVLNKKYSDTFCGYSYHALLYDGNELCGTYNTIPGQFSFFGKDCIFAFAVDAMIDPEKRNIFHTRSMAEITAGAMKSDGVDLVWGAGKAEMTSVNCRLFGWRYFGRAQTYIAVNNYWKTAVKGLKLLRCQKPQQGKRDIASSFVEPVKIGSRKTDDITNGVYGIEKLNNPQFKSYRYGYFPIEYNTIALPNGGEAVYTSHPYYPIGDEMPFSVAFILDVSPLTPQALTAAVREIRRKEKVDISVYVGWLDFKPNNMYLLPESMDIRPSYFSGKILSERIDERVFDLANWNLNLSCSDVI